MDSTNTARARGAVPAMLSIGLLGALLVMIGPAADPAFACSCGVLSDEMAFEYADAVFIGDLVDYEPPPNRDVMSSADPATWTFEVSEVYKGEVGAHQEVVSEVLGSSCGLELPREGEFLVFATEAGFEIAVGDGQYYAGLCGGTRATSAGPLAVDAAPSPSAPTEAAAESPSDGGTSPAIVVVVVAIIAAAVLGGVGFIRRRTGGARG